MSAEETAAIPMDPSTWRRKRKAFAERELFRVPTPLSREADVSPYYNKISTHMMSGYLIKSSHEDHVIPLTLLWRGVWGAFMPPQSSPESAPRQ
jgi:hypothetical protein